MVPRFRPSPLVVFRAASLCIALGSGAGMAQESVTGPAQTVAPEGASETVGTTKAGEAGASESVAAEPVVAEPASTDAVESEPIATEPVATEPTPEAPVLQTTVRDLRPAERLRRSSDAVTVVDTKKAREQTNDLGEVLARTQGVTLRRDGGLGSTARFALNGMTDDQVRFFLDGVPLALAGYPFGVANVPVNLVERLELFRGVVPVRLGADALGGAVNLVSLAEKRTGASASYQVGSFGTNRLTAAGTWFSPERGLFARASGFFDAAKNDYPIDVQVTDDLGRLSPATVRRFHDGYRAFGGTVQAGVEDRRWAKHLSLQAFASTYDKSLQHNVVMTVPYGEATYGETVYGGTLRYEVEFHPRVSLDFVAAASARTIDFLDVGEWRYGWNGERIAPLPSAGEVGGRPSDQSQWENAFFSRANVNVVLTPTQSVLVSLTPNLSRRTGDERRQPDPNGRDPLASPKDLRTLVGGVSHEARFFSDRFTQSLFAKGYFYDARSEDLDSGGTFRRRESQTLSFGGGASGRLALGEQWALKASYEYATRLPRPDEVFGNGVLILPNTALVPERSHNLNAGPRWEWKRTAAGSFTVDVNAFLRDSDRLIVLLGNDRAFSYQNVYRARGVGVENSAAWQSPGRWLELDGSFTWQDLRNASNDGAFAPYADDRIPNRPWLFGSWGARVRLPSFTGANDTFEPFYGGRYVHRFFRDWESQGAASYKQDVPSQVTHQLGVTVALNRAAGRTTLTLEADNLLNARVFDNFGVQRPGRAFYAKVTAEF